MSEPRADHGDVIELARTGLESSASTSATITDVKHLASYNWIEASSPTIAVPGSPARWSPPRGSRQVRKDSGLIYIAQNAARHPSSPLEPLFRSLFIEQPSFDISSVDVVTDRNNIRKLLSFINPSLGKNGEPFTIQVDMAGQTAIFCRDETATTEVIRPDEFRGYGHEFEKAYTVSQIRGSTGHHRVISYRLGGLNFLVRHETDGYVEDVSLVETDTKSTEDNLVNSLRSLSLSAEGITSAETPASSILTIRREGVVVPRESTLEIKTRVSHKPLALREVAPQLWVSQTPKLIRAYHQRGKFAAPEVEDVTAAVKDWEQSHQEDIKKLVALISRILQLTRDWSGSSTIRYNPINDRLVVERVKRKKALPDDLYTHWSRTHPVDSLQISEHRIVPPQPKSDNLRHTTTIGDKVVLEKTAGNKAYESLVKEI